MSVFSTINEDRILHRGSYFFLVFDSYPVSPGHILIISNEEKPDYFSLTSIERHEMDEMILLARDIIEANHTPDGYNIGMNCGKAAGQSIMHFHCHVIPRYKGDMQDPKGGIRHCIAGKGYY